MFTRTCLLFSIVVTSSKYVGNFGHRSTFSLSFEQDKKEEIWPSAMTKALTPTEMSKGQSDNTNNATKKSIKQRMRTDLGRSVEVITVTQLVWLTGLRADLPTNRNSRVIKRTHI